MADVEYRQARTAATQHRLMRAMEKLSAQHGVENVTVKAVIEEAEQKNESALQYHFKSKEGLINAIHRLRFAQTQTKRRELLTECLAENPSPTVHDLCYLLVAPTFQLCRDDAGYRQWIKGFGAKNATVRHPMLEQEVVEETNSIRIIVNHLKGLLTQLDEQMFENRYLMVVRIASLSMSNHAKEKGAFCGPGAAFFLSNLVDVLSGIFTADVSSETCALAKQAI